jgi:hypothetical protein
MNSWRHLKGGRYFWSFSLPRSARLGLELGGEPLGNHWDRSWRQQQNTRSRAGVQNWVPELGATRATTTWGDELEPTLGRQLVQHWVSTRAQYWESTRSELGPEEGEALGPALGAALSPAWEKPGVLTGSELVSAWRGN